MKYSLILLALLPFLQQSCQKSTEVNPDLAGYTWKLISAYGETLPDSVQATLFLAQTEPVCNGSGGCNAYGADYTLSGNALEFSKLVNTEKACLGKMDWEADFFNALLETEKYQIDNGKLELLSGGNIIAVLE